MTSESDQTNKIGRPTKYKPMACELIDEMGRQGYHVAEMAMALNVSIASLYEWAKHHPDFSEAFTRARDYSLAWHMSSARNNLEMDRYQSDMCKYLIGQKIGAANRRVSKQINDVPVTLSDRAKSILNDFNNGLIDAAQVRDYTAALGTTAKIEENQELKDRIEKLEAQLGQ